MPRISSLLGSKHEEETQPVKSAKAQAEINIFAVAFGLLYYKVSTAPQSLLRLLTVFAAVRIDHDPQHAPQHEKHRQVVVHQKLPPVFVL